MKKLKIVCYSACVLCCISPSYSSDNEPVRSAKVLHQSTLAPFSLANFGYSEEELAIAQLNGMPRVDLPAIGSGLERLAGNHYVGITDRGVALPRTTLPAGRVFPLPSFTPTLVFFQITGEEIVPQAFLPIVVDDAGTPATGLANSPTEDAYAYDSQSATVPLDFNQNGLDTEDLHTLPDGNFIVVDEYSPSIAIISENGKVLKRYTPGTVTLPSAVYPVSDILPQVLKARRANRGFEAIAVSRDGKTAYTMTQSPLGPTGAGTATRNSRVLRVLRLDISDPLNLRVTGQFVMLLSHAKDYPDGNRPQDLKLSAAAWVAENKLLLIERSDEPNIGGAKLILIDLTDATDVSEFSEAQNLDLENSSFDFAAAGIDLAASAVVYRNEETPEITDFKLEGLTILNRNDVAVSNDNDFGVEGGATSKIWVIRLAETLPPSN